MSEIGKIISVKSSSLNSKGRTDILHVAPSQGKWSVRSDSSVRARNIYETKQKAIISAQNLVLKSAGIVVVHGKDGRGDYIISKDGRKL